MSKENVELTHRVYDAFNRRDLDSLLTLMDPDVETISRLIGLSGRSYYGHDGVREWWRDLHRPGRGPSATCDRRRAGQARRARDLGAEAEQLLRNEHVTFRNPRGREADKRRLLIGRTEGGRPLTLVIERTIEPTTWLIVTGWSSTEAERKIIEETR